MKKLIQIPNTITYAYVNMEQLKEKIIQYCLEQGVIAYKIVQSYPEGPIYVEGETGGPYDHSDMD